MAEEPAHPPVITALEGRFFPAAESTADGAGPGKRLMVVLHGLGDSMEGFYWMPPALELPWLNYLLVNAPLPYYIGYAWYDSENPAPGVEQGRDLLRRLFAELEAQDWPAADVILFGFSQGCLMSLDFALRHEKKLAGIVGVSGHVHGLERLEAEMHPMAREQAWLVTHGAHDEVLPLARTKGQVEQLQNAGLPIAWHEFAKGHTMDPHLEIPLIRDWIASRWPPTGT